MQQQTDSFSKFGKSFQEKLCQLMLQDRPFCDQITEVLDIGFLETKYLQVFITVILDYRQKSESLIYMDTIHTAIDLRCEYSTSHTLPD